MGVRGGSPGLTDLLSCTAAACTALPAPRLSLDMGNAGTAIRLSTGCWRDSASTSTLIGDESLLRRPMERVAVPLRQMGAEIETTGGKPARHVAARQQPAGNRL